MDLPCSAEQLCCSPILTSSVVASPARKPMDFVPAAGKCKVYKFTKGNGRKLLQHFHGSPTRFLMMSFIPVNAPLKMNNTSVILSSTTHASHSRFNMSISFDPNPSQARHKFGGDGLILATSKPWHFIPKSAMTIPLRNASKPHAREACLHAVLSAHLRTFDAE